MGRPRKPIGSWKFIKCNTCGKEVQEGYFLNLEVKPVEITEDFFLEWDPNIDEYDAFFCGKECILKYITEVLNEHRS